MTTADNTDFFRFPDKERRSASAVERMASRLVEMERKLEALEAGARSSQLPYSTVEGGRVIYRDSLGNVRQVVGRQADGTYTNQDFNAPPPPRPNTPTIDPSFAGVSVFWSGTFVGAERPTDFSHVLVYVSPVQSFVPGPSNLVGTLTRKGSLPVGPLGFVPHYTILVPVNTSGKEGPASILAGPATPSRLLGSDLFPETITETEVADDSISTPKLQANSVTALNILAEAIKAYHVEAGAITADKLSAILVLASQIIAGNQNGARLQFDETGITQFTGDALGSVALKLGADPAGGNYLTIIEPSTGNALASISSDGTISASGLALNGPAMVNGLELASTLDALPRGLVARSYTAQNSPTVNNLAKAGYLEISFIQSVNRAYRVSSTTTRARGGAVGLGLHYTDNGATPTVNDPYVSQLSITPSSACSHVLGYLGTGSANEILMRVLCSVENFQSGAPTYMEPFGVNGFQLYVEDIGPLVAYSGGPASGGGGVAQPTVLVKTYQSTWSKSWNSISTPALHQGKHPSRATQDGCQIGFNDAQIRADLAGATVNKVEFYLYANYWINNSGGTVVVGTHNQAPGITGSFGYDTTAYPTAQVTSSDRFRFGLKKPEGRWVTLPFAIGEELRDNVCKGLILDSRTVSGSGGNSYYGAFDEASTPAGRKPGLRITYTK